MPRLSEFEQRAERRPQQHWGSPREDEVLQLNQAGFPECRDWRNNRYGPWAPGVVDRLVRGEHLGWRELCGHPRFLTELYERQVEAWLEERCDVDAEYDEQDYRVPRLGRGMPSGRAATPCEPFRALYEDYLTWCLAERMEAVPERAFRLQLRQHLPGNRRFRALTDENAAEPKLARHVMGVTLRA